MFHQSYVIILIANENENSITFIFSILIFFTSLIFILFIIIVLNRFVFFINVSTISNLMCSSSFIDEIMQINSRLQFVVKLQFIEY